MGIVSGLPTEWLIMYSCSQPKPCIFYKIHVVTSSAFWTNLGSPRTQHTTWLALVLSSVIAAHFVTSPSCAPSLTGERVQNLSDLENLKPGTVRTDKGTVVEADLVFKTMGLSINTDAYKEALGMCTFIAT